MTAGLAAAGRPEAVVERVIATASGAEVAVAGDVVVKRHAARTDVPALAVRLQVAAGQPAFLPPLTVRPLVVEARAVTCWPRAEVSEPDAVALPWAEAGDLLAGLHEAAVPDELPDHGWAARLDRAVRRAPDALAGLGRGLATEVAEHEGVRALVHGDWHLGQLGRWRDEWRLLDVDDLGAGDPAWDLARPAGYWAAGLLDDRSWRALLAGYRGREAPAAVPVADWWPALDLPARCAVFVAAVRALHDPAAHSDGTAEALVAACRRMAL